MHATVSPDSGAPALVNDTVVVYMTPEMKSPNAHLPYGTRWSFSGKGYHHMMTWITSEEGRNGLGGSQLAYPLALLQVLGTVPPSVGGSAYLGLNIQLDGDDTRSATDENWGWSTDTVPFYVAPRFPGDGWESSWNCPFDFFVPSPGKWRIHNHGSSFVDSAQPQSSFYGEAPLVVRDWVIHANASARYSLYPAGDQGRTVDLTLHGRVLPDVFPLTNLTCKIRIRKEGAGTEGIIYSREVTIPKLTPGSDGKFTIVHAWNGVATETRKMQYAAFTRGETVPGGRYVVEWSLVTCSEGLKAPLAMNSENGTWAVDPKPLEGGIVTVGTIALDDLTTSRDAFIPEENRSCSFRTFLRAVPKEAALTLPEPVHVWMDIAPLPDKSSGLGPPGQGSIARCDFDLPRGTVLPQSLDGTWAGDDAIHLDSSPSQVKPASRVPNGTYRVRVTAQSRTARPDRDYHNSVTTNVVVTSPVQLDPITFKTTARGVSKLPHIDLSTSTAACEFGTIVRTGSTPAESSLGQDLTVTVEIEQEIIELESRAQQPGERFATITRKPVSRTNHLVPASKKVPLGLDFVWRGGDQVTLLSDATTGPDGPCTIKSGKYFISISTAPTFGSPPKPLKATFTASDPRLRRQTLFVDPGDDNKLLLILTPNNPAPLKDRISNFPKYVDLARTPAERQLPAMKTIRDEFDAFTKEFQHTPASDDEWGLLYERVGKALDGLRATTPLEKATSLPQTKSTKPECNVRRWDTPGTSWHYYPPNTDQCSASCLYCAVYGLSVLNNSASFLHLAKTESPDTPFHKVYRLLGVNYDNAVDAAKERDVLELSGHSAMVTALGESPKNPIVGGMDGGTRDTFHGIYNGPLAGWKTLGYPFIGIWHMPGKINEDDSVIHEMYDAK